MPPSAQRLPRRERDALSGASGVSIDTIKVDARVLWGQDIGGLAR